MPDPLVSLPSLDLLKGFVATARRMSITLAADDLCLTQSAVSRQILALEQTLGCKLLVRQHRAIALTPEGERLFREADRALRQLQEVIGSVRQGHRPVTINASIGVTSLWLLPRLGRFQQQHPEVDVRVSALNRVLDLGKETIDLTIRYCPPAAAPAGALRLFSESIAPVIHPSLQPSQPVSASDMGEQVLLEYDDPQRPWLQWAHWFEHVGWSGVKAKGMIRFNQYDQAIHAALAGQGIALGRLPLLSYQLAAGHLAQLPTVCPPLALDYAYWLIPGDSPIGGDAAKVNAWIKAEAGLHPD